MYSVERRTGDAAQEGAIFVLHAGADVVINVDARPMDGIVDLAAL
jgi:hypothetical protein